MKTNYKIGKRIKTKHGEGIIIDIQEESLSVAIGYSIFEVEIEKSAHEKLLELGLELSYDDKEYAEYFKPKAEMPKLVICISKTDKVYWLQSVYYKVDLQLSKILTQYLEELGSDNYIDWYEDYKVKPYRTLRIDEAIDLYGNIKRVKRVGIYNDRTQFKGDYCLFYDEDEVYHLENKKTGKVVYTFSANGQQQSWLKALKYITNEEIRTGVRRYE